VDACWVIGLCAKEQNKYEAARKRLEEYAREGWQLFAPGVLVGEVLFVLCRKLHEGSIDSANHAAAVAAFAALMQRIQPPPDGEWSLINRANSIRQNYGCSRMNDAIYLALVEQLGSLRPAELITFDANLENHAKANGLEAFLNVLPVK